MSGEYSVELRERVVLAVIEDGMSYEGAAEIFRVGRASVSRWVARYKRGELAATVRTHGPGPLIDGELLDELVKLLEERPEDTIAELVDRYEERTGLAVSTATMSRAVRRTGFTRKKRRSKARRCTPSE